MYFLNAIAYRVFEGHFIFNSERSVVTDMSLGRVQHSNYILNKIDTQTNTNSIVRICTRLVINIVIYINNFQLT